jgi:hypothetical protein
MHSRWSMVLSDLNGGVLRDPPLHTQPTRVLSKSIKQATTWFKLRKFTVPQQRELSPRTNEQNGC